MFSLGFKIFLWHILGKSLKTVFPVVFSCSDIEFNSPFCRKNVLLSIKSTLPIDHPFIAVKNNKITKQN